MISNSWLFFWNLFHCLKKPQNIVLEFEGGLYIFCLCVFKTHSNVNKIYTFLYRQGAKHTWLIVAFKKKNTHTPICFMPKSGRQSIRNAFQYKTDDCVECSFCIGSHYNLHFSTYLGPVTKISNNEMHANVKGEGF